jgi:hypothetical protein
MAQTTPTGGQDSGDFTFPEQINASNQAILLSDAHINNCSGLSPRAFSNKIFAHIGYHWNDTCIGVPYLGIGGESEFAGTVDCLKTAISQWGIWLKGGVTY